MRNTWKVINDYLVKSLKNNTRLLMINKLLHDNIIIYNMYLYLFLLGTLYF